MTRPLQWTKSSHSGGDTQDCVEVTMNWRKSSYSSAKGEECVEVASHADTGSFIRDSKNPSLAMLGFGSSEWSRFIGRLKRPDRG
ncbi:DUF397 domain-containing protein [Nocardiopsis gilva]|nr:DUF397 domain-containing protein [Nocardiopsis gilva]